MHIFYEPEIAAGKLTLSPEESQHCVKVLRHTEGDEIAVMDGKGKLFKAIISTAAPKAVELGNVEVLKEEPNKRMPLHMAIAPTKNINRVEWFLEKAVEIGVSEITPIITANSERRKLKIERLEKIVISAAKQSQQLWLPKLNELERFDKFIRSVSGQPQAFIAFGHPQNEHLYNRLSPAGDVTVLIGPEGDFTAEEIRFALNHGFKGVNLGESRLRTETAGVVAVATVNLYNELNRKTK